MDQTHTHTDTQHHRTIFVDSIKTNVYGPGPVREISIYKWFPFDEIKAFRLYFQMKANTQIII